MAIDVFRGRYMSHTPFCSHIIILYFIGIPLIIVHRQDKYTI